MDSVKSPNAISLHCNEKKKVVPLSNKEKLMQKKGKKN